MMFAVKFPPVVGYFLDQKQGKDLAYPVFIDGMGFVVKF
jgi:hypothetical protein